MKKFKEIFSIGMLILLSFCSGSDLLFAEELPKEKIEQIIRITDEKLYPPISKVTIEMTHIQPNNPDIRYDLLCFKKGDKMLVEYLSPVVEKGNKFLRNENNLWLYLKSANSVLRISPKGKDMGGALDNNDLLRVNIMEDYNIHFLGTETMNNANCYKFQLIAKKQTVAYEKVLYWIDKDNLLPVKKEFYSVSDKLVKIGVYELRVENQKVKGQFILESKIRKGFITKINYINIQPENDFPDRLFSINYFKTN